MNSFCNGHSGTVLAYECSLHCRLRTLPWFKHFRSHQSNLCTGQPNAFFPAPCWVPELPVKQTSWVLPNLHPTISAMLIAYGISFQARDICRSDHGLDGHTLHWVKWLDGCVESYKVVMVSRLCRQPDPWKKLVHNYKCQLRKPLLFICY